MSDVQQRRVKEFPNEGQRSQIFCLWAPETGDKWRPVMWPLRCSAWFGPHSFTHSCRVDPTSAWPSSNKIILHDLPGARKSDRFCHYFIFFCGRLTNCESSWLDFDRFRQKYQRILLHIELWNRFVHPCPHKSSYRGSCSKTFIIWQAAFETSQCVEDWLKTVAPFPVCLSLKSETIRNNRNGEDFFFLPFVIPKPKFRSGRWKQAGTRLINGCRSAWKAGLGHRKSFRCWRGNLRVARKRSFPLSLCVLFQ